ncbi:G protein-coupled receptor 89 [Pholiota conissans]|uniref:G protein-coupled receptor 89 n=1 Tax=Pholiota conissans TaxID=109636 RepID=A0A9P5YPG3_9AGAR|nr:G protein-coupled receptor 89 [Pholiota conissans]
MSTEVGVETAMLTLARFSLFFACRKYLLRTIYSDLRSISSSATPGTPTLSRRPSLPADLVSLNFESDDIELEALPPPTTHTPKSAKFLMEDATYLHASISRILFSWCFSEGCMMFALLMMQGVGLLSSSSRLLNWRISLFLLMSAVLVVIPLSVSLLLATNSSASRSFLGPRIFFSLIPVALYLFAFSYIPIPPSLAPSDTITAALSRLIVLGTIILGLLSGFGAISSSWQFIPFGSRSQSVPSEQDIDTAKYALTSIRNDMATRRVEASRRPGSSSQDTWFSRVGSSFRGSDSLSLELKGLEALEFQMTRNLEALRERREAAIFSKTFKGRIFNTMGRLFMAYCMLRIVSSLYNVIFLPTRQSSSTPDLITDLLASLLSRLSSVEVKTEELASFARQMSLVLVGIIILSSIRLVLRGATRALHVTSRNLAASLMLLVLAQIMSIYMLSTIVQMRSSFPPPPPSDLGDIEGISDTTNLFSTIPEYEVFGSLFDWSFLLAAGASVFVRWGAERVNGTGNID